MCECICTEPGTQQGHRQREFQPFLSLTAYAKKGKIVYRLEISKRSLDDLILGHECQIGTLQINF